MTGVWAGERTASGFETAADGARGGASAPRWDPDTARSDRHEHYRGIPVAVLPGLHGCVMDALDGHARLGASVAELGAGFGAFAKRLDDAGYETTAFDLAPDVFAEGDLDVRFEVADLNGAFDAAWEEAFDAVTAIEVVEHLENPRHFLRGIRGLLRPGGVAVLTTPNVECSVSRVLYLMQRRFLWFEDDWTYASLGHITPLTTVQLAQVFRETGFETLAHTTHGDPLRNTRAGRRTRTLARAVRRFRMPPWGDGEVHVFTLRATP